MGNENSRPALYHPISRALPIFSQYGHNEQHEFAEKGVKAFNSEGDREQFIFGLISLMTSNGTLNLETHTFKLLFSRRQHVLPSPTSSSPTGAGGTGGAGSPNPSKSGWRCLAALTPTPEPDDGTRLVATLVAIDDKGAIKVKIEPEADGRDVPEAFRAFKKDVEMRLERLLRDVPDGGGEGGGRAGADGGAEGGSGNGRKVGQRGGQSEREMVQATVRKAEGELVDAPPAYGDLKRG